MTRTAIILVAIAVLSGCAQFVTATSPRAGHVDLSGSDSAGVAIIRGSYWSIGVEWETCVIRYPAHTMRLTLDAGEANIFATCGDGGINAAFIFEALAGHEYVVSRHACKSCVQLIDDCKRCIQLIDVTAHEVIAASPHNPHGRVADLSTGDNTATIEVSSWGDGSRGCWLTDKYVDYLIVDAGTVTVDSTCAIATLSLNFNRVSKVRSSFHFEAETGHSYTVKLSARDKCLLLRDITIKLDPTFADINIACEPYEKVE